MRRVTIRVVGRAQDAAASVAERSERDPHQHRPGEQRDNGPASLDTRHPFSLPCHPRRHVSGSQCRHDRPRSRLGRGARGVARRMDRRPPTSARAIRAAVDGDRLEAAYELAFMGLRSSEILGVARSDLDLDAMTLTIRHQLSGSGRRAALVGRRPRRRRPQSRLRRSSSTAFGSTSSDKRAERPVVPFGDSLVFTAEDGLAVKARGSRKHFQALLERAGLPRMRLHDMRHGAVSLLVDAGAHPRVAQELLRHAPGSRVTMERYAHVTASQQRDAADLLEKAVGGSGQSVTESVTDAVDGVVSSGSESPEVGRSTRECWLRR